MKVAILGAGGVGLGLAALLSSRDVPVSIWAPTPAGIQSLIGGGPIVSSGVLSGEFPSRGTLDIGEAVTGASIIIIAVPGYGHRGVIDLLVPHLREDQVVVISSHMSLSALYLSQQIARRRIACRIFAWATTATTGQRLGNGKVRITTVRNRIVAGSIKADEYDALAQVLGGPLGEIFTPAPDVMAVTLTNVNPGTHLAVALCNLTRMEHGERWGTYYGISGAVGRLVETLDRERIALASAFGFSVHTVQEHLQESFGLPLGSVAEMAAEQHIRRRGESRGPSVLEHRYVTEDVPYGIVPLVKLGKIAGVEMPQHEAGLAVISALYGRDFTSENNVLPPLDIDGMSPGTLLALCREGYGRGPNRED